jgi:signal transduction histidine kinase
MQRPDFPSERVLLSIGRLLGTRIGLTISIATVLSMAIASTISYLIRGSFTVYSPLIAAACCISTALPVHLALRGYYTLIMSQREQMEQQQRQLLSLNNRLQSTNQELAAFSHRVAHDLRNPLTVIQLNANQLREKKRRSEYRINQRYLVRSEKR